VFTAIGRYIKAFGYLITGRVDAARKQLSANPHVVRATYDKIVEEKTKRIAVYKDAVAGLMQQQDTKKERIKQLGADTNQLEKLREGAAAKAKSVVERLKATGASMEDIKKNEEYMKCLAAYNDFSSTLVEKNKHIEELEGDVRGLDGTLANHKVQLQSLMRDISKIREEADAAVADIITAKEEQQIADMLAGISQDTTSKELADMRELRTRAKANARVSKELAGTDTKALEAEFLDYASKSVSTTEFDRLIGLADASDKGASTSVREGGAKLPE
jgi:phage shock protein A